MLPLRFAMSLQQTAQLTGLSVGWVSKQRNRFIQGKALGDGSAPAREGRRRQNFTLEEETAVLKPFLERAGQGGILVVGQIKHDLEAALGHPMSLSSVYTLLHRHDWRKLAPDKRPDEARFGRINDVRRCWAPKPMRPLCQAMLTHEYTYAYASCEPATGVMEALILPQVNTQCMQIFLDTVAARHASDHIVMVMDGADQHASKKLGRQPISGCVRCRPTPKRKRMDKHWASINRERHNRRA